MELVEIDDSKVDGLLWHQGLTDWHPLDEGEHSLRCERRPFWTQDIFRLKKKNCLKRFQTR